MSLPDRYKVTASIGGGGGGNVLAVEDVFLNKHLALKLFKQDGDSDEQAFKSEFLFTASISHPNLTRVFDFGFDSANIPFFTMELVDGEELSEANTMTDLETFLRIVSQVCSGLALLHHFGYTHNDLKMSNIRIIRSDDKPVAKILDFGLARDYDPSRAGEMAGTVEYMAPEIFQGGKATVASDIYSLGIVLYRLITGRFPFKEDDPVATISGHIEKDVPPIKSRVNFVNDNMADVVLRMLSKEPSDRPANMMTVAELLAESAGGRVFDFCDFPAQSYLETAVLQSLRKQSAIRDLAKTDEILPIAVDDSGLATVVFELSKQIVQSEFKNALIDGIEDSRTVVNAADSFSFSLHDYTEKRDIDQFSPGVVNINNCGKLTENVSNLPEIKAATVIGETADSILSHEKSGERISELLLRRFSENLEISRIVSGGLAEAGAFTLQDDGLVVDFEILQDLPFSSSENEIAVAEVKCLPESSIENLITLSVLQHPFDESMALGILGDLGKPAFLQEMIDERVLVNDGSQFRFAREAIRFSLESSLDDQKRSELHMKAGEFLIESDRVSDVGQLGWAARHFLEASDIARAVDCAWKHQKATNSTDVYTDTEKLLRDCEAAFSDRKKQDINVNARLLMAIGDHYKSTGDFDNAIGKYRAITELSGIDKPLLAEAYKDLGDIYKSKEDFKSGIESLNKALEIYQSMDNQLEVSHTLNNIGNIYWIDSRYDDALEHYMKALEIQEKFEAKKDIASTVTNIASVYTISRQYDKGIEYFKKSIEIKKEINDEPELARSYNNMAALYYWKGESGRSLNYLNMALVINRKIGAQKEVLYNLENISDSCMSLGEFRRAEEVSAEGLAMARRMEDLPHKAAFCHILGILYHSRALYGKALEYLDRSLELCHQITNKPLTARVYISKARTHLALNSLDSAKQYIDLARSITSPLKLTEEIASLKILSAEMKYLGGEDTGAVLASIDNIEKNLEKEQLRTQLCESSLLKLKILSRASRIPSSVLEKLDKLSEIDQHSTFRSHLYYYFGMASAADRLYNEALSYFEQAAVMARAFEQRELLWRINYQAGRTYLSQLEYEEAFVKLRTAGDLLKEIASNISEPDLIHHFMDSPEKAELIEAVHHLTLKLA